MTALGFAFLAGLFSILSPCVLPLLPLVFGPAVAAHRFGALALAAGLVVAFVAVGLFVATVGFQIGLDGDVFRAISAVMLGGFGVVLLSASLQNQLAFAAGGLSNRGNRLASGLTLTGLPGQFLLGVLLGTIWSPCVGPTLGAASLLAAQGRDLGAVGATMTAFGIGAALPLLGFGLASRRLATRWRGRLLWVGKVGKMALGVAAVAVALLVVTGADRAVESLVVTASPGWLIDLTTKY